MLGHIRTVERFERDAERGIMHHKSPALRKVIANLGRYQYGPQVGLLSYHALIELRDSVVAWAKEEKEFAARTGPELANEVMVEIEEFRALYFKLVPGDILFRWVPRGLGQRGFQQTLISAAQLLQDLSSGGNINLGLSAAIVEHVGVYAGSGLVLEVGFGGARPGPVRNREHYDLVVRSPRFGRDIAAVARQAGCGYSYPYSDIVKLSLNPYRGAALLDVYAKRLKDKDDNWKPAERNRLRQCVVCSHFVNAVLYAVVKKGTVATATDHEFDEVFKISPPQMWREFMFRQGLWREADAVFVGVQHKGVLDPSPQLNSLGVGHA
jgi:hypothetical protein